MWYNIKFEGTSKNELAWQEIVTPQRPKAKERNRPTIHKQADASQGMQVITRCTFCEGERGIPNLDLVVQKTGGHTCRSIKSMANANGEMIGSDACAILRKEERTCCPGPTTHKVETVLELELEQEQEDRKSSLSGQEIVQHQHVSENDEKLKFVKKLDLGGEHYTNKRVLLINDSLTREAFGPFDQDCDV